MYYQMLLSFSKGDLIHSEMFSIYEKSKFLLIKSIKRVKSVHKMSEIVNVWSHGRLGLVHIKIQ